MIREGLTLSYDSDCLSTRKEIEGESNEKKREKEIKKRKQNKHNKKIS